jgi:hypothetical protein
LPEQCRTNQSIQHAGSMANWCLRDDVFVSRYR